MRALDEKAADRLRARVSVGLALGVAGARASGIKLCTNAHYRHEEQGTSQYVEANDIRVQDLPCGRARRLARDYAHAYRINCGTPGHLDGEE
jgi:hypothetical protein